MKQTKRIKGQTSGFTIIEMLISMALLLIVFSLIGAMLRSSSKSYQATAAISEEVEITDAAARLIRYDVNLTGFTGVDGVNRDLQGDPLLVTANSNPAYGEIVDVRYFENRYTASNQPELRHITYYVGESQEGQGLLRDDNTGTGPSLLMVGVDALTTEMQPRGINLKLDRNGTEQLVRVAFNIPDVLTKNNANP